MDTWYVKCSCGYEAILATGSTDLDQTYSDLNEDFALYELFICKIGKKFIVGNLHDRYFDYKCPTDNSALESMDITAIKCPRCNAVITPKRLDIAKILSE